MVKKKLHKEENAKKYFPLRILEMVIKIKEM